MQFLAVMLTTKKPTVLSVDTPLYILSWKWKTGAVVY